MAVQSSITEYFNSRKRPAVDDVKRIGQPSKKVMILEKCEDVSECPEFNSSKEQLPKESPIVRRKLIYVDKQTKNLKQKNNLKPQNRSKKDSADKVRELKNKLIGSKQLDIRKTFNILNGKTTSSAKDSPCQEDKTSQLPGITCTASENNVNSDIMENSVPQGKELLSAETENENPVEQLTAVLDQEKTVEQLTSVPEQEKVVELLDAVPEQEKTVELLVVVPNKEKIVESLDDIPVQEKAVVPKDIKVVEPLAAVPKPEKAVEQLAAKLVHNKSVENAKKDGRPVKPSETVKSRKELNLGEIKAKLKRSSRCNEIKATLSRLSSGFSKLEKLRETRMNTEKPSLQKFDTVCFEVLPASPSKTPVKVSSSGMSPAKLREAVFKSPGRTLNMEPTYISPRKLFEVQPESNLLTSPNKIPAFQRFQALVSEGRSALTLPFKYRSLAEIFRSVETIVSMLHKRRETVTFTKLRKAVQEHLRRNIYEKHLGQIKTVYENAFEITYEKVPTIGKIQSDKYDLVLKPILNNSNSKSTQSGDSEEYVTITEMTPDVLLERKRIFYNNLLEKTKEYHEQFLLSLESPIKVDRNKITRWHPEFDVDDVPDIEPSSLPEPPNVQKTATAKDVLERARNLFGANPRLDIAMQKMSELNNKDKADPPSVSTTTTNTGPAVAALTNALKGIPKSLLEKVRAKQAARALEVMTRSPSQAKEAVRLTRLPEIARIVRNIFISEKKSVLMRETIIKKVADSYRENLSFSELNEHLDLLQHKAPELLSFCTLRKTNFVKFVKDADMSRIMTRLESLASENSY